MKYKTMPDLIPYIIINTFGIAALLISKIFANRKLNKQFLFLNNQINILKMATEQQMDDIVSRIDASTNFLASEVKQMQDEIKAEGLPQAVEDKYVSKLQDLATRLEGIGASPSQPLPTTLGTTPVPLGNGNAESNTGVSSPSNGAGGTNTQPEITNENTGANTPASDGAKPDQDTANATMNPNPQPLPVLPGDKQTVIGEDTGAQVGAQPDANGGDIQTEANKGDNPVSDEAANGQQL